MLKFKLSDVLRPSWTSRRARRSRKSPGSPTGTSPTWLRSSSQSSRMKRTQMIELRGTKDELLKSLHPPILQHSFFYSSKTYRGSHNSTSKYCLRLSYPFTASVVSCGRWILPVLTGILKLVAPCFDGKGCAATCKQILISIRKLFRI